MQRILIDLEENGWADAICQRFKISLANVVIRSFPDKETYIRIGSDVKDKEIIIIRSLNDPNAKTLELILLSNTLRENGARRIGLVAPYLAYMRQDKQFNPGEGISAKYYAKLLSEYFDWLITVDPHLHRIKNLREVYSASTRVIHAAPFISEWIKKHVEKPLIIGPDEESSQWIMGIAAYLKCPYQALYKTRAGDRDVTESLPDLTHYKDFTPVLVDDIISTAHTMIEAVKHLKEQGISSPVCIGIHGIFAGNAYKRLMAAGAGQIVTCNTVCHPTNEINVVQGVLSVI